jgi:K+ transporter
MMDTSFFLARQTLLASSRPGMAIWRERLFAWMLRNNNRGMRFRVAEEEFKKAAVVPWTRYELKVRKVQIRFR